LGNEFIEFKARFGGVAREIVVPVTHVIAIYARENGQGMAFPAPVAKGLQAPAGDAVTDDAAGEVASEGSARGGASLRAVTSDSPTTETGDPPELPPTPGRPGGKPQLKRVK
ncbi:MAG: ClpXP protease specificity-enhancing factor SspB, partial [Variovorax sp.]|nr:ClpXP protease specificity-enhancing factor SspB [Variovorax sp.]